MTQIQTETGPHRKVPSLLRTEPPARLPPMGRVVELPVRRAVLVVDRAATARELTGVLNDLGFEVDLRFGVGEPTNLPDLPDNAVIVLDCWDEIGRPEALAARFASDPLLLERTIVVQTRTMSLTHQARLLRMGLMGVFPRNRFAERVRELAGIE